MVRDYACCIAAPKSKPELAIFGIKSKNLFMSLALVITVLYGLYGRFRNSCRITENVQLCQLTECYFFAEVQSEQKGPHDG